LNISRMVKHSQHRDSLRCGHVIENVPRGGWPTAHALSQLRTCAPHQWLH
jgi:hypothetical protein